MNLWQAWLVVLLMAAGCQSARVSQGENGQYPSSFVTSRLQGSSVLKDDLEARGTRGIEDSAPAAQVAVLGQPVPAQGPGEAAKVVPANSCDGGPETANKRDQAALTLEGALASGLVQNPDLLAMRGQVNVSEAAVGVARTYPWNPFVQAQYFPNGTPFLPAPPGLAAGQSNFYVWAMQRFELAHQRRFRTQGALAGLSQVQWNIYQAELLNVSQSMRLYFAALYQKELHDLVVETAELNERLLDVVERRYKANLAKAADVTTARIAARQSRRQQDLAWANFQTALLALRQHLNIPTTTPLALHDKLNSFQWSAVAPISQSLPDAVPGPEESASLPGGEHHLAAELVEGRPDVMAAQAGIRVTQSNYQLARAARVPDVQAGPIYDTADDGTKYLGLRLHMDIPIWNNGGPLARQRSAELNQQVLTYEQLKVRATLEAQNAINRYERARGLVEKETAALVRAGGVSAELKEIMTQFQAGQADVLAVLATQNNVLQERRVYLDLLNELAQAAAAVVQATALPPQRLVHQPLQQQEPAPFPRELSKESDVPDRQVRGQCY